jgi:hypothetical protein
VHQEIARALFLIVTLFLLAGLCVYCRGWLPFPGRLPGDILIRKKSVTFYFPVMTSVLLSLLLSLLFFIFSSWKK